LLKAELEEDLGPVIIALALIALASAKADVAGWRREAMQLQRLARNGFRIGTAA
jgi:hypothetical protein